VSDAPGELPDRGDRRSRRATVHAIDQLQVLLVECATKPYRGQLACPAASWRRRRGHRYRSRTQARRGSGHRDGPPCISSSYVPTARRTATPRAGRDDVRPRAHARPTAPTASRAAVGSTMGAGWHRAGQRRPRRLRSPDDHRRRGRAHRSRLEYTTLGAALCAAKLRSAAPVYETVWATLDPRHFHRKITGVDGFLVATGEKTTRDGGRPAALYRRGRAQLMHPPLLRGVEPQVPQARVKVAE